MQSLPLGTLNEKHSNGDDKKSVAIFFLLYLCECACVSVLGSVSVCKNDQTLLGSEVNQNHSKHNRMCGQWICFIGTCFGMRYPHFQQQRTKNEEKMCIVMVPYSFDRTLLTVYLFGSLWFILSVFLPDFFSSHFTSFTRLISILFASLFSTAHPIVDAQKILPGD